MDDNKTNILDLELDELNAFLKEAGQPSYRSKQIWEWIYAGLVADFASMSNLPLDLRSLLAEKFHIGRPEIVSIQHSTDGETQKVLFRLADGQLIETVLMQYEHRRTVCISTQVGCAMGCVFCATGQMGFIRNLTVGEIVGQALHFAADLKAEGDRLSNVVFMGMGEPLQNYDNSMSALDRLMDPSGLGIGARKITVSTVGIVPAIRRFADEQRQSRLAVSLHAANDAERHALVPPSKKWSVRELVGACHYYVEKTGRRVSFEWALISGRNDSLETARELGELLNGLHCHINLIPLNPTDGFDGGPSSRESANAFVATLEEYGITTTVRLRRGIDIQAGCGQLKQRFNADEIAAAD